jgi:hypothetical protein
VVAGTRLSVTLYARCASCYIPALCILQIMHTPDNSIVNLRKPNPFLFRLFKCAYFVSCAVVGFVNALRDVCTNCSQHSTLLFHHWWDLLVWNLMSLFGSQGDTFLVSVSHLISTPVRARRALLWWGGGGGCNNMSLCEGVLLSACLVAKLTPDVVG